MTELAIALLGLALLLFIAEAHVPGAVFGLLGVASLVGAGFAYRDAGHDVPIAAIVAGGVVLGGFVMFAARKSLAAYRDEPVRTGWEEMVGRVAEVREPLDPSGQVFVDGALWQARSAEEGAAIDVGTRVRVESVNGLTLVVRPVSSGDPEPVEKGT